MPQSVQHVCGAVDCEGQEGQVALSPMRFIQNTRTKTGVALWGSFFLLCECLGLCVFDKVLTGVEGPERL